jgi:hypothetical protein
MASLCLPLRDSHPLRSPVPAAFGFTQACHDGSTTPSNHLVQPHPSSGGSLIRWCGLGSSRFARRYYGNPICSSGYMRCFSSPGSLLRERRSLVSPRGVAPFGHLRIAGCQRLPRAFRRVATSFIGLLRLGIHHVPFCGSLFFSVPLSGFVVRAMTSVITLFWLLSVESPLYLSMCITSHVRRGAAGTRTPDLRLAKAALSQLSYSPLPDRKLSPTLGGRAWTRTRDLGLIRAAL